jgi:hypothetical protein
VKALVLHQPWASLMALGSKTIETRGWRTHYRGDIAICASARHCWHELGDVANPVFREALCRMLPFDKVLCVVELYDCVPTEILTAKGRDDKSVPRMNLLESPFGNFNPGRYGWLTRNLRTLPHPVPVRGFQRIFNLREDIASGIKVQLSALRGARLMDRPPAYEEPLHEH